MPSPMAYDDLQMPSSVFYILPIITIFAFLSSKFFNIFTHSFSHQFSALPLSSAQALNDPTTQYIEGRMAGRRIWWCPSGYGDDFVLFKYNIFIFLKAILHIVRSLLTGTITIGVALSLIWDHVG
jgi:hypothetical protein